LCYDFDAMVTLRCTKKLLKHYGFTPDEDHEPTTALGDWYANIIGSAIGDLTIIVNETSRLALILLADLPREEVLPAFRFRAMGLLRRLELPAEAVQREAFQMGQVKIGKTRSRKVLGSMNEVAFFVQAMAGSIAEGEDLTCDDMEMKLARFIHMPLKDKYPMEAARALLAGSGQNT
jgi:hypothetical protein